MLHALVTLVLASPGETFPLGPLGGTARVEAGAPTAMLVTVEDGGPAAAAGIAAGDVLRGVNGVDFPPHSASVDDGGRGPQKALGEAVDAACAAGWPADEAATGALVLDLEREGEGRSVEVRFALRPPLYGAHAAAGKGALRAAAARQLLGTQRPDGHWDAPVGLSGDRVTTAWALTALLAHGDPAHREAVDRAATWLAGPEGRGWLPEDYGKGPDNLGNWAITSTMVALAEHDLARGTDRHRELLAHLGRGLVERMTPEGRFGHDVSVGYSGKGFNVINTLAHLGWALGASAGAPLDEAAWKLSFGEVEASVDPNGGIRYWTLPGTGTGDASLRTGSMALALLVLDRTPELADRFVRYLDTHAPRTREAHAVGSLGMLVSPPALFHGDRDAYDRFLEEWRWYLALSWGTGDRIHYIGGKGNNGGDSYLGFSDVACIIALQVLACEDGRLRMHGLQREPSATPEADPGGDPLRRE